MQKSLYNITKEQQALINEIEALDGEITPEVESLLIINQSELQQKSIAYLEIIKTKEAFNLMISDEIKRLQQIKKQNDNVTQRLKDNLLIAVKTFGEFIIGTHKFSTRKSSQIIVEDVNALPEKFKVVKVTEQANKLALKKAIQYGQEIDSVRIVHILNLKINRNYV